MDLSQRKEAKPDGSAEKGGGGSHTLAGLVKPIPAPYAPASLFLLICHLAASAYSPSGHADHGIRSALWIVGPG